VHARAGLAGSAEALLQSVLPTATQRRSHNAISESNRAASLPHAAPLSVDAAEAAEIYQYWTHRWRIAERFAPPDWSIVDLWIARKLLSQGMLAEKVQDVLRLGSPHFPRRHTDPDDYLRRTVARALPFPAHAAARVPGPLKKHAMDCPP